MPQLASVDGLEHAGVEQLVDASAAHPQYAHRLADGHEPGDAVAITSIGLELASGGHRRAILAEKTDGNLKFGFRTRENA